MTIAAAFKRLEPLNLKDYSYFSMQSNGKDYSYLKKAADSQKYDKYININGDLGYTTRHKIEKLKPAMANYAKATGTKFEFRAWDKHVYSDDNLFIIEKEKTGSSKMAVLRNINKEDDSTFARQLFKILEDIVKETKKTKLKR